VNRVERFIRLTAISRDYKNSGHAFQPHLDFGFAALAAQYYAPPEPTGKPFGRPEMLKAMQDMTSAFEEDVTLAQVP